MLRMPPFTYRAPKTVGEAVEILKGEGESARVVAGGTDLYPNLKRRHQQAATVVGMRGITEMHGIQGDPATGMTIGAMETLTAVCTNEVIREAYPGLARAVASISSPVLRNMGTLGGNLCLDTRCTYYNQNEEWRQAIGYCMKEVGDTCWVAPGSPRCWAVSSSDSAPLLSAVGAEVKLVGPEGERVIPASALFHDDGIHYLTKQRDELLTEIRLPPAASSRSTYWKLRRRGSIDFPVLGVGAAITTDDSGTVTRASIVLGGVGSHPAPAETTSNALVGKPLTEEAIQAAAEHSREPATPLDNTDYTLAWRKQMVPLYVEGALRELAGLPQRVTPPRM